MRWSLSQEARSRKPLGLWVIAGGRVGAMTAAAPRRPARAPASSRAAARHARLQRAKHGASTRCARRSSAAIRARLYDGKPTRFTDNGVYIGHDEPIIRFLSKRHGSGQQHHLEGAAAVRSHRPADGRPPGHRRHPLVRALDRAVVLDGALQRGVLPAQSVQAAQRLQRTAAPAHVRPGRRRQLVPRDAVLPARVRAVRRLDLVRQHALVRVAAHQRPRVPARVRELQHQLRRADQLRVHPDERRAHRAAQPAARQRRHGDAERRRRS